MAKDNKIHLPSSGGGLVNYSDEHKTKLAIDPYIILAVIVIITVLEIYLYKFGPR